MKPAASRPLVAIACGGTGGHLFPGMAVAGVLQQSGCDIALLISQKDVDQQAAGNITGMEVHTLPSVGLQDGNYIAFGRRFVTSFLAARRIFLRRPPAAVLAMGGFTSAPPVLAARRFGAKAFLHESNTVPGKANRFLARIVDEAFAGFAQAAPQLRAKKVSVTGTPVRPEFSTVAPNAACRLALGLDPVLPTLLVVGGSQGARGLNDMVLGALPLLRDKGWQWLHLTGAADFEKVRTVYARLGLKAAVKPFLAEMELALGAATACVSRAGASSLAEIAAMRLPSVLVPLPHAADNHQYFNAYAFAAAGAAEMLEQKDGVPEKTAAVLSGIMGDEARRSGICAGLARCHSPQAAARIAGCIESVLFPGSKPAGKPAAPSAAVSPGGAIA